MKTTIPPNVPPTAGSADADHPAVNKAAQSAREIVDKVATAANQAACQAIPAIDRAAQFAHKAVDSAETKASSAAEWLDDHAGELDATQEKLLDDAREYIAANPLKAVGAAFVVGLLLARLIR